MVGAVPTVYNGITFRSKLEADWARYFDASGITWSYEAEHYRLSNGEWYLPDFHLPTLGIFVECRGNLRRSLEKPAHFLMESRSPLLVALPEGRFFLATLENEETGEPYYGFFDALRFGDVRMFEYFQQEISCFVELDDDAEGLDRKYFCNAGFSSPDYCGHAPDWMDCVKDRSCKGNPNADARSYYYGGFSTWEQRGFRRHQHVPHRSH